MLVSVLFDFLVYFSWFFQCFKFVIFSSESRNLYVMSTYMISHIINKMMTKSQQFTTVEL